MLTDLDSRDPLTWLSRILYPNESTSFEKDGPAASGYGQRWWASPSASQPKVLIPAGSNSAARTAVRRYHDGFSPALRARSLLAETLISFAPLGGATLRRHQVTASPGPRAGQADPTGVPEAIAKLTGIEDLHLAVSLSTPKSNQKPVLQLLDGGGRCHGWAKIAWNDRTDALVANEARWTAETPTPPLSMPALLHDVKLAGRRVVICSSVSPSRVPKRSPTRPPSPKIFRAVSTLGTPETVRIKESPWLHSVEEVLEHATPRERLAMQAAVDSCYRLDFEIGAWHGDLTPWNLMTTRKRVHLIDWEFAADGVPFGFDLCHFHTQVGSEMRGYDALDALDYSARLSPHGLALLGVAPENRTAVWRLYLVELLRRTVALRAGGYPTDQVTQGSAALNRLERSQGASRSSMAREQIYGNTGEVE